MSPSGSERDPEMMKRAKLALLSRWPQAHPLVLAERGQELVDFARAEVRRELVEELERLRRKVSCRNMNYSASTQALIDDRLRELHVETEQPKENPSERA